MEALRVFLTHLHLDQTAEADNHGNDVVEVMRHTAGKLADCIHLLGMKKLGFEALAFGNVLP
jgi:hypothetical protein